MIARLRQWFTPNEDKPVPIAAVPRVVTHLQGYEIAEPANPKVHLTRQTGGEVTHCLLRVWEWETVLLISNFYGWRPRGTDAGGGTRGPNPWDTSVEPAGHYRPVRQTVSGKDAAALASACRIASERLPHEAPHEGASPRVAVPDEHLLRVRSERRTGRPVIALGSSLLGRRGPSALDIVATFCEAGGPFTVNPGLPAREW